MRRIYRIIATKAITWDHQRQLVRYGDWIVKWHGSPGGEHYLTVENRGLPRRFRSKQWLDDEDEALHYVQTIIKKIGKTGATSPEGVIDALQRGGWL